MIAAPSSGSGKTTVTCALLEALKRKGCDPVSFKCGPDYIDPMFHKKVLGIEGRNLDTFFAGSDGVKRIVSEYTGGYAVIEGVMGIYDGMSASDIKGSCYEIAKITRTPIVLTADAKGIGRTVISVIKGVLADDEDHLIKGIILNRMSEGFFDKLKVHLEQEISRVRDDVKLLGFIPNDPKLSLKSRHLGLLLPKEIDDIREKIETSADAFEEYVDIKRLLEIMEDAEDIKTEEKADHMIFAPGAPEREDGSGCTLAVASDDAFCFIYRDNIEAFEKRGVTVRYFSPLEDDSLPEGTSGILLPGGYPELYLEKLSANTAMLSAIKSAIEAGVPSLAECGGFMYLHDTVADKDGRKYKMAGVIDGDCAFTGHLVRFGYMYIKEAGLSILAGLKGHEFHYYESSAKADAATAAKPNLDATWDSMICAHNGIWGFPHFYYDSSPKFVDDFIAKMKEVSFG